MQSRDLALSCLLLVFSVGCTQQNHDTSGAVSDQSPQIKDENCISSRAVVTYFLPKGRIYLTNQEHVFCPGEKELQICSREPQGFLIWTWGDQQYSRSHPSGRSDACWEQGQMAAVYAGFLYGGGFLSSSELAVGEPLNLEGQRYISLSMDIPGELLEVIFYQNQDTEKIDLIIVMEKGNKQIWMAKLYNWSFYSPKRPIIPRKIDIFDITDGLSSKKLIVQIDYKQVL